ncbi:hypothetical protein [uncultured Tateyamaria sp.]|uniref:hypothetical protein n=1 Tax=uncultured Tateyamaria sp. TaxID=455651 RepID=UPI002606C9DA|nr:hypothetical protein [uncultured Tateyamaria sp.]
MMLDPDLSIADRIEALVATEVSGAPIATPSDRALLKAFCTACIRPFATTVNFSGGITQRCWTVTRTDGAYRVVFLPLAGYFALCVESDFGPLDIGVHGPALGCFASV